MNMDLIMKQAQQLQQKMGRVQEELAHKEVSSTVGGGMITATVNGKYELLRLVIEKEAIDPNDPGMLQDLIIAAVNDAMRQAQQMAQSEMSKLTGGIKIPGIF